MQIIDLTRMIDWMGISGRLGKQDKEGKPETSMTRHDTTQGEFVQSCVSRGGEGCVCAFNGLVEGVGDAPRP